MKKKKKIEVWIHVWIPSSVSDSVGIAIADIKEMNEWMDDFNPLLNLEEPMYVLFLQQEPAYS